MRLFVVEETMKGSRVIPSHRDKRIIVEMKLNIIEVFRDRESVVSSFIYSCRQTFRILIVNLPSRFPKTSLFCHRKREGERDREKRKSGSKVISPDDSQKLYNRNSKNLTTFRIIIDIILCVILIPMSTNAIFC